MSPFYSATEIHRRVLALLSSSFTNSPHDTPFLKTWELQPGRTSPSLVISSPHTLLQYLRAGIQTHIIMDPGEAIPALPSAAELIEQVELLDAIQHLQNQNQTPHQGSEEETMSATNQVISNSPAVSNQTNLNTTMASNQAGSIASLAPGQTAAAISSDPVGTGNSAASVGGNNGQVSFNPTITSNHIGSNVSTALGQASATIGSGTTGTGSVAASATGVGNIAALSIGPGNATAPTSGNSGHGLLGSSHASFHIGRPGMRYTPAWASAYRNRPHTEVDYRCGICTGDLVAGEKAAVRKSSHLVLYITPRLHN